MAEDPYRYFRVEARELSYELMKGALDLDKGAPSAQVAPGMLRHAHTLKGAARVVRQPEIADHAHAIEEALDPFRESAEEVPKARLETLLGLLDDIRARIMQLPSSDGAAQAPTEHPQHQTPSRTLRGEVGELDVLLDGVGEAHARVGALANEQRAIGRVRELAASVASQLSVLREVERGGRGDERLGGVQGAAGELLGAVSAVERGMGNDVEQLDRELREIRDRVERLRLVPGSVLFIDLERAVRDVAQAQAKQVAFEGRGGDVRLDADLLAAARSALQQIVRNAVVHGIEPQGERRSSGKPAVGHVTLEIARLGHNAVFTCRDDGRGIDLDAVRDAASRRGLLADSSENLGPSELMRLLLRGGISTSGEVTELSGRGIGLDVVRDFVARVGGETTVTTRAGTGTTVELEIPLSLAAFEALTVESNGVRALIPLEAVVQTVRVEPEAIHVGSHGESLAHKGTVLPFLPLSEALSDRAIAPHLRGACSVVIIAGHSGTAAIGVERLLGTSSVVVRPLPSFLPTSPVVSGIWLDAEGNPQLVLDADGVVARALQNEHRARRESADAAVAPILVIDDSLTTRMLEQSILESANYRVEVASSAEEGIVKARSKPYLLFLVDVEMPGMDGFTFVEQTRADPVLRDVPAILVTSRSAPADRQRGFDVGASAYVAKGEFDQGALLERIRELTAR